MAEPSQALDRPDSPAVHLREFCATLLALLPAEAASPRVSSVLCRQLLQALGEGARPLLDDLRGDLRLWDAALHHLALLRESRFLEGGASAAALQENLEHQRALAERLVAALEALQASSPPPVRLVSPPPLPPSPPALPSTRRRLSAPSATPQLPHPQEPSPVPSPPSTEETAAHQLAADTVPELPVAPPTEQGATTNGHGSKARCLQEPRRPAGRPSIPRALPAPGGPAPPSTPPADPAHQRRPEAGRLPVHCPRCGTAGGVNWQRLNKILVCPSCRVSFTLSRDGTPTVVVQDRNGRWIEAEKLAAALRRKRAQRRNLVAIVASVTVLAVVGGSTWWVVHPKSRPEAELPRELAPRAELFARAWLRNDVPLMRRLTSPTHDRILYSWYTRHRPPSLQEVPEGIRVEVNTVSARDRVSVVHAHISGLPAGLKRPNADLTLSWEERDGVWFCLPPPR